MNSFFGLESPIVRFLTKVADLVILNVIFIITCIPFFTIGAAIASMYEVTLKMVKDEESYIAQGYFKAFKSNFKKSTGIWLGFAVIFGIFFLDLYIINQNEGTWWNYLYIAIFSFAIVLWVLMSYVFPLQAKFENTIKNTLKNAWYMGVKHLPTTVVVVFFNSIFPVCMLYSATTFVYGGLCYVIIGFAMIAYINSVFLIQVFEKYYHMDTEAKGIAEEE